MWSMKNRKEILVTFDIHDYTKARDALISAHINYYLMATSGSGNSVAHKGDTSLYDNKTDYSTEYQLFVHKKDYEKAQQVLGNMNRHQRRTS